MKKVALGKTGLSVPAAAVGCMRLHALPLADAERFVAAALDMGMNFFDHADIYGRGESETLFGKALKAKRSDVILQSKCGIRKGFYDFSKEHILAAVDGSLKRLSTDYLDVLLLHRPDALIEPDEVAEALAQLHASGKVLHFGVSNFNPMQIELLKRALTVPLSANQLQFSPAHAGMAAAGLTVNTLFDQSIDRDGGVLDYCRLHDITVQAWSPFQFGFFEGVYIGSVKHAALNKTLDALAQKYGVTPSAVALAWIFRHPAAMQAVTGTTKITRLMDAAAAMDTVLTREEWYDILKAAGSRVI